MGIYIMMLHINILYSLLFIGLSSASNITKLQRPYVESYWESWRSWSDFPEDFAAFLKDVPASPIGSCQGVNVVNIAFGDYKQGISGHEATDEILTDGITAIHDKGGYVKIALGGAMYSMSNHIHSVEDAARYAETLSQDVTKYHLDGVDLDVEDSGASAEIQIALIKEIRRLQ